MQRNQSTVSAGGMIVLVLCLLNVIVLEQAFVSSAQWYKLAWITLPLLLLSVILYRRRKPL